MERFKDTKSVVLAGRTIRICALAILLLPFFSPLAAMSENLCGVRSACPVKGGNYRIELPQDGDIRGVYIYFHGFKSSADLQLRQRPLVEVTLAHHLAYVAVDGIDGGWSFPHGPRQSRNDIAFIKNVLDDLRQRHGFTPAKTVMGGFSIGASMAWYAACREGEKTAAMVTFSGVFWNPLPGPDDCVANLPPIVHFHGTADQTFPLAGRAIGTKFYQGDARKSLGILRQRAKCNMKAAKKVTLVGIECEDVPDCIRGDSIMCIHNGGHEARADMLDAGLTALGFPK
ncbi:poly(3-hydroxybutyrate) depolymerase [Phyllobacterium sp. 0TCS1.6C]|uniref:alpha/beta hydrolase family esterase n=1 Tax=unclassified Phyllobacterium TaxID=2638441 RepID=UPI00226527C8|nr:MULTISPECIES: poly(3-hydroxybutyrate) depolymerase [unclassified Phyllobacterium]MCX8279266.1 poly(3-hydroxybutyrate) depolymerase [Phyllobacterium sp. 0TCS1.6C]MCX8294050.1 poly(3-hydroxybutyrate) depolymerase [Phyllobacterium sp. 0TCS1.6A]